MRDDILLTGGIYLQDRIISLRGEVWTHIMSLTLPLFIEVSVPSLESVLCICVLAYRLFDLTKYVPRDMQISQFFNFIL